jgi:hypothetical protein
MNREDDLKYLRSVIDSNHAFGCVESVVNRLWERIDKNEHALRHVLTMQVEMQENIVKLNKWLTPKETAKCPIQD